MTRRSLLAPFALAFPHRAPKQKEAAIAPTDEGKLNAFAGHYNAYVERLRRGQLDVSKWREVSRLFEGLN